MDRLHQQLRALEDVEPLRRFLLWLVALLGIPTLLVALPIAQHRPLVRLILVVHAGSCFALLWASARVWVLRRSLARSLQLRTREQRANCTTVTPPRGP